MSDNELAYRVRQDTGELYVWPLSRWTGLLLSIGGKIGEMPTADKTMIKCIIFPSDKVKAAKKLVDNINNGEQEYKGKIGKILIDGGDDGLSLVEYGKGYAVYGTTEENKELHNKLRRAGSIYKNIDAFRGTKSGGWVVLPKDRSIISSIVTEYNSSIDQEPVKPNTKEDTKIGQVLIDGGDNGLSLVEYDNGLAIYGAKWEDKDLHKKLKDIGFQYKKYVEPLRGSKKGGWLHRSNDSDKATILVEEYNSSEEHKEPAEEDNGGYQEVRYYLEKPYVGQEVSIDILGKTINTKVISIVPGYNEVVDLIQLDDEYIAAIVAGRWELLYEANDHVLSFH